MTTEQQNEATPLPFIIKVAESLAELEQACQVRTEAYSRHEYYANGITEKLKVLDNEDRQSDLLIAVDKVTGAVLGTLRTRASHLHDILLPPGLGFKEIGAESFAYADRFGVFDGEPADLVAKGLMKAFWLWANAKGAAWLATYARAPMARRYRRVGLRKLKGEEAGFQLPFENSATYFALGERLTQIPENLYSGAPDNAKFILEDKHPEICVLRKAELEPVA